MSSRLFIARITTMLLLLLGGFGIAMADAGGGSPLKGTSLTKGKVFASTITGIGIGNGGNVTSPNVVCSERTIRITPSISLDPGVNTVSVSYTIAPTFGPIVNGTGDPGASHSIDYAVPQVSAAGGMLAILVRANFSDGSSATFTTSGAGLQVWAKAAVTPVFTPASICLGAPASLTGQPTPTPSGGNGNSAAAITSFTVVPGSAFTGSGVSTAGPGATATFTPTTAGANAFTMTGSNAEGCTFTTTANLSVIAAPTGTVVPTPNPVCAGQTVSFSVSGSNAVSAVIAGATPTSSIVSPFISTTSSAVTDPSGTFTVSYTLTGASGCTSVATASYSVVALPSNGPVLSLVSGGAAIATADAFSASVTATPGSVSVCQNSTLTLSLSACDVVAGGVPTSTSGSVTVAPGYVIITTSTGTATVANGVTSYALPTTAVGTQGYQVACVNSNGCSSTALASFTVTVLSTPTSPTLVGSVLPGTGMGSSLAGQNIQLCQGQSLTATLSCPAGSVFNSNPTSSTLFAANASPTSGSVTNFTLTAGASVSGSASFTVLCRSTSGTPVCDSPPITYTLTVNALPANGPFVTATYTASAGAQSTTINATAASSGSSITVCQNTSLLLSVTGCTASNPASTSTNPIIVITPGGAIGGGASVTLAGGPGTGTFLVSTTALSTTATGPYIYSIVCVNASGCSSSAVASLSVTVNPSPNNASITAVGGTPADLAVAPGGSGSVTICQGAPLRVNTDCVLATGTSSGTANTATGVNSGATGSDGTTAAVGGGVPSSASNTTFAAFNISTTATGVTTFTFACVGNPAACASPLATTLTVTVNASAAAPTTAAAVTVCENSGNVVFATACGTNSATIVSRPTIEASSATITSNSLVIGSVQTGTFVYGVQCRTSAGCSSSTTSYTVIVNPRPVNANLSIIGGTTSDTNVAGGQLGSVVICQGQSLSVNTNCLIAAGSTNTSGGNTITGNSSTGVSGSALSGGVSSTVTSATNAAFVISTSIATVTTYTFVCQNTLGCTSPLVTSLVVTVNPTPAAPAITNATQVTACENGGTLGVDASCATGSLVVTGAGSMTTTMAQVKSTTLAGVYSYTLQCVTPLCASSTTTISTTIVARPNTPGLTVTGGTPTPVTVSAGQSGSVAICQGNTTPSVLTVVTTCQISAGATGSSTANVVGGVNSGQPGFDNSASVAIGVGTSTTSTSPTFATFTISTASVGTFNYAFQCQNSSGCLSYSTTTITVTVNASVAAASISNATQVTACENGGTLGVDASCATGSSLVVTGAGSLTTTMAQVKSTTMAGVYSYTLQCVTPTCASNTTTISTTIVARPNTPSLTAVNGNPANVVVAAGGSGAVQICQGNTAPVVLTVVTSCMIADAVTSSLSANQVGGVNSGSAGFDNSSSVAVGGGTSSSVTPASFATFTISTASTGTFSYTFACRNAQGCLSYSVTTLAVTVSSSVAAPTGAVITAAAPSTVCQFGTLDAVATCSSGTAIFSGAQSFTGSTLAISTTAAGTYQYSVLCKTATCESVPQTFTVIVNAQPQNATVAVTTSAGATQTVPGGQSGAITICEGTSLSGLVTGCPTTSGVVAGSVALITGSGQIAVGGSTPGSTTATTNTFSIPGSLTAGTYNYTIVCTSIAGTATCVSPMATTLVVNVNAAPISPTATYAASGSGVVNGSGQLLPNPIGSRGAALTVCLNTPINLTVNGCNAATPATNQTVTGGTSLSAVLVGGQLIAGQTNLSNFVIANSTVGSFTYAVYCQNPVTGCTSLTPLSLSVTVQELPVSPVASSTQVVCETNSGILTLQTGCGTSPSSVTADVTVTGSLTAATRGLTSSNTYTISTAGIPDEGYTGTVTIICRNVTTNCLSATSSTVSVTINGAPALASLTAVGGTPANVVATASTPGAVTICQFSPLVVNTDCLISAGSALGTTLSVTGVNSSLTGTSGVPDGSTASVGGIVIAGGTSPSTFASYRLPTATSGSYVFTVVCQNAAGCRSLSVTSLSVTVNAVPPVPAPTATLAGVQLLLPTISVCETTTANSPISITSGCPTGTSLLVANTSGNLVGGVTGGTNYTIQTSGIPAGGRGGSLTLLCQNTTTGCVSTTSYVVSVTINPAPTNPTGATIAAGSPAFSAYLGAPGNGASLTICQGQPVSLTVDGCQMASGSAGGTSIGGTGSGFIFSGTGFTFTPVGPTTSTAVVTDGNLQQGIYTFIVRCKNATTMCESLAGRSFTLVVTGIPSAVAQTGFAPTCAGGASVTGTLGCTVGTLQQGARLVGATGAYTPLTVAGGVFSLPATAGLYNITAVCTTGGACLGAPISFTVANRLRSPAPISVQTTQNAVCLGSSTTLVAVCPTGATSATWFFTGTPQVVPGTTTPFSVIVTPMASGSVSYEAVCNDPSYACPSVRSTDIILNVLPGTSSVPAISAQPNPTVAGAPVTLTGAGCAGTVIFYVAGTNTEVGRSSASPATVVVNPQVTTQYEAVCTNGQCTSNRTTAYIVNVTPCTFAVNVTPSSAVICSTGGSAVLTASGGTSYVWNNGANTQSITVTGAGVYNVVVTSAQGCTAMGSATVTTGTPPTPTITGNTNIVQGQSTQLTAGGGVQYTWSGPGITSPSGAVQTVGAAGTYTVVVTSASGCTAAATVTVTVAALPGAPTVTPTAATQQAGVQACVGQSVLLQASCSFGMPRFKMGNTTTDGASIMVSSATPALLTYQVVCVVNGAEGPATTASVNFNAVPNVQILQTGVLCTNQPSSATLSATGAASYTWSTGQVAQSIVVPASAAGLYSVNGANAAGCVNTASLQVSAAPCAGAITALNIGGATIDCVNGNVTIQATGGNGNQIQYSIGGSQYSASNTIALDPAFQNNPANSFIQLYARQVNGAQTGFDVAGPFQFNFRAICPVPTPPVTPTVVAPQTCGSPANTIGQPLVVTGVDQINCANGSFRVLTTGGDGTAIDYSVIIGLSNANPTNCIRRVDNNEQLAAINNPASTIQPFRVDVKQSGVVIPVAFCFDFKSACLNGMTSTMSSIGLCIETPPGSAPSVTTPPAATTSSPAASTCGSPANTIGQPLVITGVDMVNCQNGTFRILTTGGNGQPINHANIVGLSNNNPYDCTRMIDNAEQRLAINNPNSTIAPFPLRVVQINGGTSNTFSFNMKQVCSGSPRVARTETNGTLDVTVLGNPTLGETVEVEVRGAEGQALQLRLVDGLGSSVSEKSVEKAGAVERQTISLGRSAGIYFLQVTTPDKAKTVKVVRQ